MQFFTVAAVSDLLTTRSEWFSTLLVFSLVLVLSLYFLKSRKIKLPPGPLALPVVGSIPFIENHLSRQALKYGQRYGSDVVTFQLGPVPVIILNTYDAIKEAFSGDSFMDRPDDAFFKKYITGPNGIAFSDGKIWKEQRRFSLTVLRDFGLGKMAAVEKIHEELDYLVSEIDKTGGKQFNISPLLTISSANIISSIVLGRRYSYDDKKFLRIVTGIRESLRLIPTESPVNTFPWLRHLPGDLFHFKRVLNNFAILYDFAGEHIREHQERFDPNNISDFLDAYLAEKKKQDKLHPDNTFTDDQMKNVIVDLFLAGTETSSTTILFGLLYLITHEDVQQKVQQEIDAVLGSERKPTMAARCHLPFTEATVLEIHRVASIAAIGLPHTNNAHDVIFRGYTIPKGAFVFPNIWAVHRDPAAWKSPNCFDPQNHLDDDGKVVYRNELLPFSLGRRQCPGEAMGKMEVFIILTTLLQQFSFSIPDGAPEPSLEVNFGTALSPRPFELCAVRRR